MPTDNADHVAEQFRLGAAQFRANHSQPPEECRMSRAVFLMLLAHAEREAVVRSSGTLEQMTFLGLVCRPISSIPRSELVFHGGENYHRHSIDRFRGLAPPQMALEAAASAGGSRWSGGTLLFRNGREAIFSHTDTAEDPHRQMWNAHTGQDEDIVIRQETVMKRVHLKKRDGWTRTQTERADFSGPPNYILPECPRPGSLSDSPPAFPSYDRRDFQLVRRVTTQDFSAGRVKEDYYYEER